MELNLFAYIKARSTQSLYLSSVNDWVLLMCSFLVSVYEKKCAYVGVLSFVGVRSITHHTVIYNDIHYI